MFWDSLNSALDVMTHWETYLVVSVYLFSLLIPSILIFLILKKKHALHIKYFRRLFLPILESIAIAVAVLTLFPIIFGVGDDAQWGFPIRAMKLSPGSVLGLVGILLVVAYIIDVIPKLRKLQSIKTLVLGSICLIFAGIFVSFINPVIETDLTSFIPGFWFICGIIATSAVLSKVGHFVFVSFTRELGNKFNLREDVAELLILPIIATMGFLPVFIYGAWL